MTARDTVNTDVQRTLEILIQLQDEWQTENREAVLSGGSDIVAVSSGGTSNPTQRRAMADGKYAHRDRIGRAITRIAEKAQRELDLLHPEPTGHACVTDGCERDGLTPDGRCSKCSWWMAKNAGVDPATVKGLVQQWNKARVRLCECVSNVCAEHPRGHDPDACTSKLKPDDGRTCGTCRKRIHDHRQRHQEAS